LTGKELRNDHEARFGFFGFDNITATNATNMKKEELTLKKRENNTPNKLRQLDERKGSCAHSETSDSKMCRPTNTASYRLHRSPRTILKGSIVKYMVIFLRHNMYDRLWWLHKTDKVGVKD
jgi:hypothetical protein